MKIRLFTPVLIFICSTSIGQKMVERKINFFCTLGVAKSVFKVSSSTSDFGTPEFRLGIGISKPVQKFEFKTTVLLGVKGTRPSYQKGSIYTQYGLPLHLLDETVSSRSHLVLDIPVFVQYNLSSSKLGLRLGLNPRFWAPNDHITVLTARQEIGLIGGVAFRFNYFSLGADVYYGFTKIFGGSITYNGQPSFQYSVKNVYYQITLEIPVLH